MLLAAKSESLEILFEKGEELLVRNCMNALYWYNFHRLVNPYDSIRTILLIQIQFEYSEAISFGVTV